MPLPANIQSFVDTAYQTAPPEAKTVMEHRKQWREALESLNRSKPKVASTEDFQLTDNLSLRVYSPEGKGPFPLLIYYPGGAFVYSDIESADPLAREFCTKADCIVVNVKTRVAPEHTAKECLADAYQAFEWCKEHANDLNSNASSIILAGDSSGGNFAALTAIKAAQQEIPVAGQLLVVSATDLARTGESHRTYNKGYLLDRVDWFYDFYAPTGVNRRNPEISPAYAEIPPSLAAAEIIYATYDPLASDSVLYFEKLQTAGVEASIRELPVIHGMHLFEPAINTADHPETAVLTQVIDAINNLKERCNLSEVKRPGML